MCEWTYNVITFVDQEHDPMHTNLTSVIMALTSLTSIIIAMLLTIPFRINVGNVIMVHNLMK